VYQTHSARQQTSTISGDAKAAADVGHQTLPTAGAKRRVEQQNGHWANNILGGHVGKTILVGELFDRVTYAVHRLASRFACLRRSWRYALLQVLGNPRHSVYHERDSYFC
jgi:hypothetical protein